MIKRWIRLMLGFKATSSARAILSGIEMVHMIRKGQVNHSRSPRLSIAGQFSILAG